MRQWARLAVGGLAVGLLLAALPALGAEGRTPIWAPTVLGPGSTGKYIVTRNITNVAGPVITVAGGGIENVDIDLNGMTLTGGGGFHVVDVSNAGTFVLRNGTIQAEGGAAGDGVKVVASREVVIEDLTIQPGVANGIFLGDPNNQPADTFAIRRNLILGPAGTGIVVDAGFT